MTVPADSTLDYLDQGSFLGLRALGRGPVIQYTWIYEHDVNIDGLRRFQRNLEHTLLSRLIERSPLPFGRHRWVTAGAPGPIDVSAVDRHRDQVGEWLDERAELVVDPEIGPPWHLGLQPLIGGGAVVSLVTSHSIVDAAGLTISIAGAVDGARLDPGHPPPKARTYRQAVREDLQATISSAAALPAAFSESLRIARDQKRDLTDSVKASTPTVGGGSHRPVVLPAVTAYVDVAEWDRVAAPLSGTRNALFAGFAARLGHALGRVDDDGMAMLTFPVSERTEFDTRANALTMVTVTTDPAKVLIDLAQVRADLKKALTDADGMRAALLAPLPLTPFTPKVLLRRLERMVLQVGKPIGCSNLGDLPDSVNRPDGTDAEFFSARQVERGATPAALNGMDGTLLLGWASVHGRVSITVGSWVVGGPNTKAVLRDCVLQAFADFGIAGTVE